MPYDLKVAIKKVTATPTSFALIEGKKTHMVVFVPTPPVLTEVQTTCGQGKVIAKGLCLLEGKTIVFKTKAPPQTTTWSNCLKKIFVDTKCPPSPFEFRQLAEGESDEVESHEGQSEEPSTTGTPQTTTETVTGRPRSGAVSGGTPPQTPPVTGRPRSGGMSGGTPPQPQGWKSSTTPTETKSTGVTIGTKMPPTTPPKPETPGGWKSATPTVLQQAKAEFERRLKAVIPAYQKALPNPRLEQQKEALFKKAGMLAGKKDWDGAHGALDSLEILLGIKSPQVTKLADNVEALHRRAALHSPAISRNTAAAREAATRLIKPDGTFDTTFDALLNEVGTQPNSPQKKHLSKILSKLKDDPALREKITSIPQPDPKNPATDFIRATLGLKKDEVVTAAHARQAAVSALIAEMRQNDVGSCFGTSVAVRVHDEQPGRFLDDMVALMKTGKLTRTVNGQTIEVPISPKMSTAQVEQPLKLKRSGAKVGDDIDLHATPGFGAALESLGIASDKRKAAIDEALADLRNSKTAKIKAAIAALPDDVDAKTRKKLETAALDALRDAPDSDVKTLVGEVTKNLSVPQKEAAASACDNYDAATEDDATPKEILQQVAMKRAGLTEKDLLLRERMQVLGAKVRAMQGETGPEAQKLFDEYSRVSDQVTPKISKFQQLDKEMGATSDSFLAQQDNRLLRAWEYSLSAMAEKGIGNWNTSRMTSTATKTVNDQMDSIVTKAKLNASPTAQLKIDEAAPKLKQKFEELFKARLQSGYDASVQGELSADGSSDRGAFALYDTTGAKDPSQWIKITDARGYADVVSGLMMESCLELYGNEPDEELRKQARLLADQLADASRTDEFVNTATENTKPHYSGTAQKPWEVVEGNFTENLLPVYYEQPAPTMIGITPANTTELMSFLVSGAKGMWNDIKDGVNSNPEGSSVPLSGGPHAFNLRPGSPVLKGALESGDDPDTWVANRVNADKEKARGQRETKLTPSIKAGILDQVFKGYPDKDDWVSFVDGFLGGDPTVDDLRQALEDCVTTPEAKESFKAAVGYAMTSAVLPPVESAKVEGLIEKTLKGMSVPEGKLEAVKNRAKTTALSGNPATASMADIEKAVAAALKSEGVEPDEAGAATKVNAALRGSIEPPGMVFADTNWGGGDHHIVFSMVTNPVTDELEMWQMNEDGSEPSKMKESSWVTAGWRMPNSPTAYGGV